MCNAYGYAFSNQIPVFFPNYHVIAKGIHIYIGVLDAQNTKIVRCKNMSYTKYGFMGSTISQNGPDQIHTLFSGMEWTN